MAQTAKIIKQNDEYILLFPDDTLEKINVHENDFVDITYINDMLVITKSRNPENHGALGYNKK